MIIDVMVTEVTITEVNERTGFGGSLPGSFRSVETVRVDLRHTDFAPLV